MTPDETLVAVEVEAAVRAVVGVETLYRPGSALARVLDAGGRLLSETVTASSPVVVSRSGGRLRVEVCLGVFDSEVPGVAGAVDTVRGAHAAVRSVLASVGDSDPDVVLTVVHVAGPRAAERSSSATHRAVAEAASARR